MVIHNWNSILSTSSDGIDRLQENLMRSQTPKNILTSRKWEQLIPSTLGQGIWRCLWPSTLNVQLRCMPREVGHLVPVPYFLCQSCCRLHMFCSIPWTEWFTCQGHLNCWFINLSCVKDSAKFKRNGYEESISCPLEALSNASFAFSYFFATRYAFAARNIKISISTRTKEHKITWNTITCSSSF